MPAPVSFTAHEPSVDTTGQRNSAGVKPKTSATYWEDENTFCVQVEVNGYSVARREGLLWSLPPLTWRTQFADALIHPADNNMVNGTKLLNVAKMTRGRRDGILKGEKDRKVIKIGPMHLKGVWIPFERALEISNKEHITEKLFPLFVHEISSYRQNSPHPKRLAGAARRSHQAEQSAHLRTPQSAGASRDAHHSSSSLSSETPQNQMPQTPQSNVRTGNERVHTFLTPPASAGATGAGLSLIHI